jgi:hypothetical protein
MFGNDFLLTRLALHAPRLAFAMTALVLLTLCTVVGILPNGHMVNVLWPSLITLVTAGTLFLYIVLCAPELRNMIEAFGAAAVVLLLVPFLPSTGHTNLDQLLLMTDTSRVFMVGPAIWIVLRLPIVNSAIRLPLTVTPTERYIPANLSDVRSSLIPDPTRPEHFWQSNVTRLDRLDGPGPGIDRVGVTRIETNWETFATIDIWSSQDSRQLILREHRVDEFGLEVCAETAVLLEDAGSGTHFRAATAMQSVPLSMWLDAILSDVSGDYWDSMRAQITGSEDRSQHHALQLTLN